MSRITPDELERTIAVLEAIAEDRLLLADAPKDRRLALLIAAGRVSRPTRAETRRTAKGLRRLDRAKARERERDLVAQSAIRTARLAEVFVPPTRVLGDGATERELEKPRNCYVCKELFT